MSNKKYLYLAIVLLSILDGITTMIIINANGIGAEINPIMYWLIDNYLYYGMWGAKLIILVPLGIFVEKFSESAHIALIAVFAFVAIFNVMSIGV